MAQTNGLTRGERRILELIKRCDFTGGGCRPTQDELAFLSGYKRPYVNACVKSIERKGFMRIEKERRPGCKWTHNVYFVRNWSPHKRSGICNLRRAYKEHCERASRASSDTERTARPSRARTALARTADVSGKDLPSLSASSWKYQRCGREARENGLRRFSSMDQPKRRHLHVADLTCIHCAEKDQEIQRKTEIVRALQFELNKAMENEAAALEVAKAAGNAAVKARSDETRKANEEGTLEQIEAVVAHWRYHRPQTSTAFGKPNSTSYRVIKKALGLMAEDPVGSVKACMEAIDGLHIAPWQEYDRRFSRPAGPNRVLRNSVEHALGDEQRIAKCRAILRKFRNLGPERAWEVYTAVGETYWALGDEVLDLLGERPLRRDEGEWATVDGVRTRVDKP